MNAHHGKTALVTGASSGIGWASAAALAPGGIRLAPILAQDLVAKVRGRAR
jgi:NAD(P)-dependent dehydrogenase (short-subunit alcohol dehydrogenase family)